MTEPQFISIDQNCHALWDVVPKLHALAHAGLRGTHLVEDVDVAFTRRGAGPDTPPELLRERYYRGGVSDWGAALFYTEFLGRTPLDLPELEPYTGMTTAALSRKLGCTVDELYDRYSPSDNWQLVGPSYLDGNRARHRTIGDLRVGEAAPFVRQLLCLARRNVRDAFPAKSAHRRIDIWFDNEQRLLEDLLGELDGARLPALYRAWLGRHCRRAEISTTSAWFDLSQPITPAQELLDRFVQDYETWGELYNRCVEETGVGVHPLNLSRGELPAFAVWRRDGRQYRTSLALQDARICADDSAWPLRDSGALPRDAMRSDGVVAVCGKALLLVLQVRLGESGRTLALPYQGSLYMPAARLFEQRLRESGRLARNTHPVMRVRLNLYDHLNNHDTPIRVPVHLRDAFGAEVLPLSEFCRQLPQTREAARRELDQARDKHRRDEFRDSCAPGLAAKRGELDRQRRELARTPETRPQAAEIWNRIKELDRAVLTTFVERVIQSLHVTGLDYWNSRGAVLPWCVAAAGRELYEQVVAAAEVYPDEPAKD